MTWFLVVLFLTINGAELQKGWYPLEQPSLSECQRAAEDILAHLNSIGKAAVIYCIEVTQPTGDNV